MLLQVRCSHFHFSAHTMTPSPLVNADLREPRLRRSVAEFPLLADGSPRPKAEVHDRPLSEGEVLCRSA